MGKNYRSEIVGVFGYPVDENPTGVMEEAAFAAKGLDFRYITMKVAPEDLGAAMAGMKAMNMRGINLTIPHKVEVLQYLDELSEAAEIIGAVNMVVNNDGVLWGENTDGKGFLKSLVDKGAVILGKNVFMLGAGGAARAICVELALAGAKKISVANVTKTRGEDLVALLNTHTETEARYIPWDKPVEIPIDTDILCNATSVGLFPDVDQKPDINYETILADMLVTDVIFNDPHSLFLKEAEKWGARTINGLGMLANQGALNFTLWTGVEAPLDVMVQQLCEEFGL